METLLPSGAVDVAWSAVVAVRTSPQTLLPQSLPSTIYAAEIVPLTCPFI